MLPEENQPSNLLLDMEVYRQELSTVTKMQNGADDLALLQTGKISHGGEWTFKGTKKCSKFPSQIDKTVVGTDYGRSRFE